MRHLVLIAGPLLMALWLAGPFEHQSQDMRWGVAAFIAGAFIAGHRVASRRARSAAKAAQEAASPFARLASRTGRQQ